MHSPRFFRVPFLSFFLFTSFLTFQSCSRELETIEPVSRSVASLPENSEVICAGTWRSDEGEETIAALLREKGTEKLFLFPSGREVNISDFQEAVFGTSPGEFLCWGYGEDQTMVIQNYEGVIESIPLDYYQERVILCSNGKDYAYLDWAKNNFFLYKNGKRIYSSTVYPHVLFDRKGRLYFSCHTDHIPQSGEKRNFNDLVLMNEDRQILVPAGIYSTGQDNLKVRFDPSNRLFIESVFTIDYEESLVLLRRADSHYPDEVDVMADREAYGEYLKKHSLFCIDTKTDGSPAEEIQQECVIYKQGEEYAREQIITEYDFSPRGDSLTYGAFNLKEPGFFDKFSNTSYRAADGTYGLDYHLDFTIKRDAKTLFQAELVKIRSLARILGLPADRAILEATKPVFSRGELQEDGLVSSLEFAGDSRVLMNINMPVSDWDDYKKTEFVRVSHKSFYFKTSHQLSFNNTHIESHFQINRDPIEGIKGYRLLDREEELPPGTFILIGQDEREYPIIGGKVSATSFDRILGASSNGNGMVEFTALEGKELRSLTFHSPLKETREERKEAAPDIEGLTINERAMDDQGIYLATDQGMFISFDGGKSWEQHNRNTVLPSLDQDNISTLILSSDEGYLLSQGILWKRVSNGRWEPLSFPFESHDMISDGTSLYLSSLGENFIAPLTNPQNYVTTYYYNNEKASLFEGDPVTADLADARFYKNTKWVLDRKSQVYYQDDNIWTGLGFHRSGDERQENIFSFAFGEDSIFLGTWKGLFRSRNGGTSWVGYDVSRGVSGNFIREIALQDNRVFALTGTTVVIMEDGIQYFKFVGDDYGYRWSFQGENAVSYELGEELPDYEVHGNRAYREKDNYCGISYSYDGGTTWENIHLEEIAERKDNSYWGAHIVSDENWLYLSIGSEIYKTGLDEMNWQRMDSPGDESVREMKIMEGKLYIRTESKDTSRYFFFQDGWQPFEPESIRSFPFMDCQSVESDGEYIYAYPQEGEPMKYSKSERQWFDK